MVMAEVSGEGSAGLAVERNPGEASGNPQASTPLSVSASFKEGSKGSSRRRASVRPSLDADEFINLLHGSDPVKLELNRLENEVRGESLQLDPLVYSSDLASKRCCFDAPLILGDCICVSTLR